MEIIYNKKKIEIPIKKSLGIRGLMFRRKNNAPILLFENVGALHSFFVFFPFIALWLDKNNNVVDLKIVKPFTLIVKSEKKSKKIIEISINKYHDDICYSLGVSRRGKHLNR